MKSLVKLFNYELEIIHNGKSIEEYKGSEIIKELIKDNFSEPIYVTRVRYRNAGDIEVILHEIKTLKPGDSGYIEAVLLDKINKEMNMKIIYNINDRRLYE